MRWRVFALVSVAVNVALAIGLFLVTSDSRQDAAAFSALAQASASPSKTNTVVRRQFFSWQEVESPDYPTYIANLRDIGCPEQTIRDIIIADINALYSRRRATELVTPEQQWWRSEPDTNVLQVAAEKLHALEEERRALLTRLLGPSWESGDLVNLPRPSRPGVVLDGPVLGSLPADVKQALQEVNVRSEDRLQTYLETVRREGRTPDSIEMTKLQEQMRAELERILPPAQLEEYLLRYSQNAKELRAELGQLRYFNATQEEFRQLFRATDYLDRQIRLLGDNNDPMFFAQRRNLEDQRDSALRAALGPKRYEEYHLLHDPLFRDAIAAADQAGTPEAARTIYQINLAWQQEQARVDADTNLTAEQKNIELKQLELDQLKAKGLATGQELPPEPAQTPTAPPRKLHVLGPGDSLATVSLFYGVPISAIRAANPNLDFSRLKPGDSINVPPAAANLRVPPPITPR